MQSIRRSSWVFAPLSTLLMTGPLLVPVAAYGVQGAFDYPLEVYAVAGPYGENPSPSSKRVVEIALPVSFRTTKGSPEDVLQIEVELTLKGEDLRIIAYEPQTGLATDVVGEIEETVTQEGGRNWGGAVGASLPIPGLQPAQLGPSVNLADTDRVIRTEKIRRRPGMKAIVVAGTAARGRGVFFQLRPGADVTLEGAQHFVLQIEGPDNLDGSFLEVNCRALGREDWFFFETTRKIASSRGKVKIRLPLSEDAPIAMDDSAHAVHAGHSERPCPLCDVEP